MAKNVYGGVKKNSAGRVVTYWGVAWPNILKV